VTAVGDADALAEILTRRFGFTTAIKTADGRSVTLLLHNVGGRQILRALEVLRRTLTENDSLLVFYAGHGWRSEEADQAYWLPSDAEYDFYDTYISASQITDQIRLMTARAVLVISDSCYSGGLNRGADRLNETQARGGRRERVRYLDEMTYRRSRVLVSSGSTEPVMDGGGDGHSVFARALLNGLTGIDRDVFTAEEVFHEFIKEAVVGRSEQSPQFQVIQRSGHEGGDFVFWQRPGRG
jgi:uncharacterized caspase-like protein